MKSVLIVAIPAVITLVTFAIWSQFTRASGGPHPMSYTGATAHEEKVVSVAHAPRLVLQSDGGNVKLTGGNDGTIYIAAEKHALTWEEAEKLGFMTVQEDNVVKIAYRKVAQDQGSIDFTIVAPRDTALSITTGGGNIEAFGFASGLTAKSGGGDIGATDVAGPIRAKTGGGNIECGGLSGTIDLATGGGNISATGYLSDAVLDTGGGNIQVQSIDGVVSAKSGSGNISIGGRLSGTSQLSTGSGNIRAVIPPDSAINIQAMTANGSIDDDFGMKASTARSGRTVAMNGQLNGGSSTLAIHTSNGDISIDKG